MESTSTAIHTFIIHLVGVFPKDTNIDQKSNHQLLGLCALNFKYEVG